MRRTLPGWLLLSVLLSATVAAAEDPPPPPPPPPPSETGSTSSGGDGSSPLHQTDGLFDVSAKHRPQMLSFFVGIPYGYLYYGGFPIGLAARYYIPIMHDGFVPAINDEFGIEFGGDFNMFLGSGLFNLTIPVQVLYDVHLIPKLDFYGKVGLGFGFYFGTYTGFAAYNQFQFYYEASVGLRYQVTSSIYLRAELGWPWIRGGIGIAF